MAEQNPEDVTLNTLHEDLKGGFADLKTEVRTGFTNLKAEVRAGFTDLKATMVAGFRNMPPWQSSEEIVRLLREGFQILAYRPSQLDALDVRIQVQALELQ